MAAIELTHGTGTSADTPLLSKLQRTRRSHCPWNIKHAFSLDVEDEMTCLGHSGRPCGRNWRQAGARLLPLPVLRLQSVVVLRLQPLVQEIIVFSSSMFAHQVKGISSEQWAIVEFLQRGFPPEILQSEETPLPHHLWKCYLQKSMIPRNCSSMCIACAEVIRRRLTSTCMVAKKAWGKGGGGQKAE